MDFEKELSDIIIVAESVILSASAETVPWSALKWDVTGPSLLFKEYTKAGSWVDYIMGQVLILELRRNKIVDEFIDYRASALRELEGLTKSAAKRYVEQGFSYQERAMLVKLDVPKYDLVGRFDEKLAVVDSVIQVLRGRAKMFMDFKNDAKAMVSFLTFGNQLGELR